MLLPWLLLLAAPSVGRVLVPEETVGRTPKLLPTLLPLLTEGAAAFQLRGAGARTAVQRLGVSPADGTAASRLCAPAMGPQLHGSQQSRSPLVNWYAEEQGIPLETVPPRPSRHPFQQVPYLVDDEVEVFESGAILLYLADRYGPGSTPTERAAYTKWVVWSNSELDGLCFGAVPGDHRVRGTSMDRPELKAVSTLEGILSESEWLVGGEFSVADVAVGSYLNYVPIFFPNADLSRTPAIAAYMKRCAERPAFASAFGEQHAQLVQQKAEGWMQRGAGGKEDGMEDMLKKLMR